MGQGKSKQMNEGLKAERSYLRPFGTNLGELAERREQGQYPSTLYFKLGTRVATVTAHYEHRSVPVTADSTTNSRSLPKVDNNTYANISPLRGKSSERKNKPKEATILETEDPIYEVIN